MSPSTRIFGMHAAECGSSDAVWIAGKMRAGPTRRVIFAIIASYPGFVIGTKKDLAAASIAGYSCFLN